MSNDVVTTQTKSKGGRPPGSKNLRTREANKRLSELNFDPIEKLVRNYESLVKEREAEQASKTPSKMHVATLMAAETSCIKELLRYGYSRASETAIIRTQEMPKMQVVMTPKGFKPGDTVPVLVNGESTTEDTEEYGDNDPYDDNVSNESNNSTEENNDD